MKVSVVVPAFNEEKLIGRSLAAMTEACEAFRPLGWEWELVVCDNNSTDRTAELAQAAGAKVVFEPINQISRARNKGGFAATGDWLIFVDADSFPSAGLFAAVAERIQGGRCIGGGCLVTMDESRLVANVLVHGWNLISRVMRWAAGSFVYCDARVFRELGGFSDKLYASEEIEFSERLKKAGRAQKRRMMIIRSPALVTSARKMHLYKTSEYLRFLARAVFSPRRVLTTRGECIPWYDGRR